MAGVFFALKVSLHKVPNDLGVLGCAISAKDINKRTSYILKPETSKDPVWPPAGGLVQNEKVLVRSQCC